MEYPDSKSSSSQKIGLVPDDDIGLLVTCSHPSITVEFPGRVKPETIVGLPLLLTTSGPSQEEMFALDSGVAIISNDNAIASVVRPSVMLQLGL